jgi:hypothetical protein
VDLPLGAHWIAKKYKASEASSTEKQLQRNLRSVTESKTGQRNITLTSRA